MREPQKTGRNGEFALAILSLCLLSEPCFAADRDPWWGQDKALHFSACFMFAVDGYAGTSLFTKRESARFALGAGLAVAAGAAKEVYDRYSGGDPSLRDLTWDVVGATTGAMLSWLVDRYLLTPTLSSVGQSPRGRPLALTRSLDPME